MKTPCMVSYDKYITPYVDALICAHDRTIIAHIVERIYEDGFASGIEESYTNTAATQKGAVQ